MKQVEKGKSSFSEELFYLNEIKNNRLAAITLCIIGTFYIILCILYQFGLYDLVFKSFEYAMITTGVLDIIICIFASCIKYNYKYLRDILIIGFMLSSGLVFFFYPQVSKFVTYGPVVISALYYDKKLIKRIAAIDWVFCSALLWANVILEKKSAFMQYLHNYQYVYIWQEPLSVLLYQFIPYTIVFIATFLLCIGIAHRGTELIKKNAEESAVNASIKTELKAASDIQRSSLPDSEFEDSENNLRINSVMRPAKTVGGDFYDYFYLNSNIVVLVADVSDKGLPAAMFMMKAKNAIRSEIKSGKNLKDSIFSVNNILASNNKENMFVTLWVASINVKTGVGEYVNCGHLFPLICHADGNISKIENEPNTVLGLFEDLEFSAHEINFSPKDTLFIYTDGLTDAINQNEENFGEQRLMKAIYENAGSENPCKAVVDEIDRFSNKSEQFDDMTALALRLS